MVQEVGRHLPGTIALAPLLEAGHELHSLVVATLVDLAARSALLPAGLGHVSGASAQCTRRLGRAAVDCVVTQLLTVKALGLGPSIPPGASRVLEPSVGRDLVHFRRELSCVLLVPTVSVFDIWVVYRRTVVIFGRRVRLVARVAQVRAISEPDSRLAYPAPQPGRRAGWLGILGLAFGVQTVVGPENMGGRTAPGRFAVQGRCFDTVRLRGSVASGWPGPVDIRVGRHATFVQQGALVQVRDHPKPLGDQRALDLGVGQRLDEPGNVML